MSGVLIIAPLKVAALAVTSGTGKDNLLTASPREVWAAGSTATQNIDIDMGTAVTVDSFFVGSTNAGAASAWTISTGTGLGTGLTVVKPSGAARAADSLGPHHMFHRLSAPVTSRYFRITVSGQTGAALYAGNIVLGLAFEQFRELGGGRQPLDTGARQSQSDGGFGSGSGVVKALFNWTFIDLSEADIHRLWGIVRQVGLRSPCVVVEDAGLAVGQNEAIHYGVFEKFQPYERREVDETRWSFSHEEWR